MDDLTPRQLVAELDKYIVGQADAKRAVAVAVRNRWRRRQLTPELARDVSPKNIVMSGPTGVGKTEIARRLATLVSAPFVKVEATKFTEVGYYGRDVESIVRDLVEVAIDLVRREQEDQVKDKATNAANERLLDALLPSNEGLTDPEAKEKRKRTRDRFREQLLHGDLEDNPVEISVERAGKLPFGGGGGGGLSIDPGTAGMLESLMPKKRETKKLAVKDARPILVQEEAAKLIDDEAVGRLAIERAEQTGIVFLDEIDKVTVKGEGGGGRGPDVSRQGVQRDLLPIVEGSTVTTKHGPVKTDHVLFIAAGAFHGSKVSDLMPELQGRFPIRVALDDLEQADFVRILTEPQNALIEQQKALLGTEGVTLNVTDDAIPELARVAHDVNRRQQNIGARRLYTIVERVLEDVAFEAPDLADKSLTVDAAFVRDRLGDLVKDEDLSHLIL